MSSDWDTTFGLPRHLLVTISAQPDVHQLMVSILVKTNKQDHVPVQKSHDEKAQEIRRRGNNDGPSAKLGFHSGRYWKIQ